MGRLKKIYKNNIYGIIGTLSFHIILVLSFLLADVHMKGETKEDAVIIEFPDVTPDIEEAKAEEVKTEEAPAVPAENTPANAGRVTNQASNQDMGDDDFFDKDYQKEVEEARKLISDVNNQLDKKVIDINDIQMPVETTEGINPDSIRNVIYTGESNITYHLKNRYHIRLPIPVYLAQGGGTVVVDIVVKRNGSVIKASARKNNNIHDAQIYFYAEMAALNTLFNTDNSAPEQQTGYIQYVFIAQ
ncbi:hypothetical protein MNBD_BACTEROID01-1607 [hydrothermal vent metagenome]|uniref:Ferric siderophore transport system, periplasmic binding protein TonB n=1 Tax=hydrothermal vent metagenome TaxID=652676 RepID=A0A3B0T2L1_9ZZZZ